MKETKKLKKLIKIFKKLILKGKVKLKDDELITELRNFFILKKIEFKMYSRDIFGRFLIEIDDRDETIIELRRKISIMEIAYQVLKSENNKIIVQTTSKQIIDDVLEFLKKYKQYIFKKIGEFGVYKRNKEEYIGTIISKEKINENI